jgi:hypothetical protein
MNVHVMRGLLALYPRAFRDRYGTELASVTDDLIRAGEITPLRATLSLAWGAALEWWRVLFWSRRVAQAMAAAAIIAVAGSLYLTSQIRPQSTPASARNASAQAYSFSIVGCGLRVLAKPAGSTAILNWVVVRQTGPLPGQLSIKTPPLPPGAVHFSPRPIPGCTYVILSSPRPAG